MSALVSSDFSRRCKIANERWQNYGWVRTRSSINFGLGLYACVLKATGTCLWI